MSDPLHFPEANTEDAAASIKAGTEAGNDLVERIRGGDAAALDTLMDRYWEPLVSYAGQLLGNWDSAEDVTQEAFVRIWERRETWDAKGSVKALLYRIVRNLALDLRKVREREGERARRVASAVAPVPTPLDVTSSSELEMAFHAALENLSPRRREVYELVRFRGLSYREVGEILDLAPQTVANHLSAAVALLRERLSPFMGEEGSRTGGTPPGPAKASRSH